MCTSETSTCRMANPVLVASTEARGDQCSRRRIACSRGRRFLPPCRQSSPRTTTAPKRSGPSVPSSSRRMRTSAGLSPSPTTIGQRLQRLTQREQAEHHDRERGSGLPARQQPQTRRRERPDTRTSVRTSPVDAARLPAKRPGSVPRSVASGTSGYIVCSVSIAIAVVAKMPATAAAIRWRRRARAAGSSSMRSGQAAGFSRAARAAVRPARPPGPVGRSWPRRTGGRAICNPSGRPSAGQSARHRQHR